ncbi:hypothetical protein [Vibrio salinus]|uniref:hypothetical protein n=1 Tax=Vibrio salinus TaxID=2899784 RepID=UPI001E4D551C|nr:hypothetical protein [Vibrio salinus]MCE0496218.1 hypothetical protein [Vibrio salinus]
MYKIKQSVINKRKRSPYFTALYVTGFAIVCYLLTQGEEFDWIGFSFVFGLTGILSVGANLVGSKRFIKYALNHAIIVTNEGLKIKNPDTYSILPWENVTQVKQKLKSGQVSKLSLRTSESSIDLTNYEQLDKLVLELKQFIKPEVWK